MTASLPQSSYSEFLLWLLRRRKRFRINGLSMIPLLQPGEEVLVNLYAYQASFPQVDDLVLALHPHHPDLHIIKRVVAVAEDGSCFLQGDNLAQSDDSRSFGAISVERILGRVTSRFV